MKKVLFMALAMLVAFASCKKEEKTPDPATISIDGYHYNEVVDVNKEILVYVNVICTSTTIEKVQLYYTVEGAKEVVIDMEAGEYTFPPSSFNYKAIIPAQDKATTIKWYVVATAQNAMTTQSMPITVTVREPILYNIVLNEISGVSKYIELYNPTDTILDISGYQLKKNDEEPCIWTAEEGLVVPSKGYLVLYSEKSTIIPEGYPESLIFKGGISPKKSVKIELLDKTNEKINAFTRGIEPWDTSLSEVSKAYARTPDGYGKWKLAGETPGKTNPDTGDEIPQE